MSEWMENPRRTSLSWVCLLSPFLCASISAAGQTTDSLDAWELRKPLPPGVTLNDVCYGNGLWVGVGYSGTIATSLDGSNWTMRTSGTTSMLMGVGYGEGLWVAVGDDGTILTSGKMDRRPSLSITVSGNNAAVSWPLHDTGFVLESTTDLVAPQNWSPVNVTPAITNSMNTVHALLSDTTRFYRLRKQ